MPASEASAERMMSLLMVPSACRVMFSLRWISQPSLNLLPHTVGIEENYFFTPNIRHNLNPVKVYPIRESHGNFMVTMIPDVTCLTR